MVRSFDRLQFAPVRVVPAPARTTKTDTAERAGGFQKILREQSATPAPGPARTPVATPATSPAATPRPSTIAAAATSPPPAATANLTSIPPAAAPTPAPAPNSLHAVAALPNGGRMVNPTGNNALTGGTIPYNPDYYATQEAAVQLAWQLGGTVVDMKSQISNNQSEYYINLPNGTSINAGNLLGVLNNPVYQENSRVMDGKIAELLNNNAIGTPGAGVGLYTVTNGQVKFDPTGSPTVYPVYTT